MEPATIALVLAIFFLAAFLKGTTGLGFSTSALPFLALTIGVKAALPLLIVPSLASNIVVMAGTPQFREMLTRFAPLYAAAMAGVVAGLALLAHINGQSAGAVLGAVLLIYCLWSLAERRPMAPHRERPLMLPVGLLTGTVNGVTGSQVMPLLPYLLALRLAPAALVQASNISFTLSSLVMCAGLTWMGLMSWTGLWVSLGGLLPVYAGVRLGTSLRNRLSERGFRRGVIGMLGAAGVVLLVRPFI